MSTSTNAQHQAIISILEQDHIHPDIFKSSLNLQGKLSIAFPSHTACAGETIERVVTKDIPSLVYRPFNAGGEGLKASDRFTLIMIDPDLLQPNDTLSGQVRHWVQPGITFDPAELDKDGQVVGKYKEGDVVTDYIPCSPGPPGHKHRYIFCLARETPSNPPSTSDFPHPPKKTHTTTTSPNSNSEDLKDRSGFDLEQYIEDKGMEVVGVTFIKVGPDSVEGWVENAKLSGEAAVNKVLGR